MTQDELALAYGMYERSEARLNDWQKAAGYGDCFLTLEDLADGQRAIKYGRILTPDDANGLDPQIMPHYFVALVFKPHHPPVFETIHTAGIRAILTHEQMDLAGVAGWPQTMHQMLVAIVGRGLPVVVPLFMHKAPLLTTTGPIYCVATNDVLGMANEADIDTLYGPDGYVRSDAWCAEMIGLSNAALFWNGGLNGQNN